MALNLGPFVITTYRPLVLLMQQLRTKRSESRVRRDESPRPLILEPMAYSAASNGVSIHIHSHAQQWKYEPDDATVPGIVARPARGEGLDDLDELREVGCPGLQRA